MAATGRRAAGVASGRCNERTDIRRHTHASTCTALSSREWPISAPPYSAAWSPASRCPPTTSSRCSGSMTRATSSTRPMFPNQQHDDILDLSMGPRRVLRHRSAVGASSGRPTRPRCDPLPTSIAWSRQALMSGSWIEDQLHFACDARVGVADEQYKSWPAPVTAGVGQQHRFSRGSSSSCCNKFARACSFAAVAESLAACAD